MAKAQRISAKVSKRTYTADQFRAGKKTFKIGASAKTKLTYKVTKGSKYVSVNKCGAVTVKRWTPKGTYKISVTAKATKNYKKAAKTVTVTVKKAPKGEMANVSMMWDLKNNKNLKFKMDFIGSPLIESFWKQGTLRMTNFKKKKISNGKKYKITYDLQFNLPTSFTKSEVDKMNKAANEGDTVGSWYYGTVVDYQTGEVLEYNNKYGVKVSFGKWKHSGLKKYYGTGGNWYRDYRTAKTSVTITYPKEYKDLCILAGGCGNRFGAQEAIDWQGWKKFFHSKSALFPSGIMAGNNRKEKSVCHGMRVK